MRTAEQRRKAARISMFAWYAQIAVAIPLSLLAVYVGGPWPDVLLVYVTAISVWAGIESAHARINADLPLDDDG